jgi:hypothetical protein
MATTRELEIVDEESGSAVEKLGTDVHGLVAFLLC